MPNYRRACVEGGSYFFTLVTHQRAAFLTETAALGILGDCLRECQAKRSFTVDAIVILPDHFHAIWTLPPGDADYSARWAWIKKEFTKRWLSEGGVSGPISAARHAERRRGVWQPRFWEHCLEDEDDFERHFDYMHFNPVKHGLVACPHEWEPSSFHRWVTAGVYEREWACGGSADAARRLSDMAATTGETGSSGTA